MPSLPCRSSTSARPKVSKVSGHFGKSGIRRGCRNSDRLAFPAYAGAVLNPEVTVRARRAAALLAVFVVLVAVVTYVVVRKIGNNLQLGLPTPACTVDAGTGASLGPSEEPVTLDLTQAANAATIGAVGLRRGMPAQA